MIITTTPTIQGKEIVEYKGVVFGEIISGINFIKDMGAGLRNIFGGRSEGYEQEVIQARDEALEEMKKRAQEMGANGIVGVKLDYEALGSANNMLMVIASGTAVILR